MNLLELRDSLSYPYTGLIFIVGLFLTVQLRGFQIPHFLLGVKIASGALDARGKKGLIAPGRAFATGAASSIMPGALIGSMLALSIAGTGILFWIWITSLLSMAIQFGSSTLSLRYRKINGHKDFLESGPAMFIEKVLNARWLAWMIAVLIIIHSLLQGNVLMSAVLNGAMAVSPLRIPPITIGAVLFVILTLVLLGGIKRLGLVSSRVFLPGLIFLGTSLILALKAWSQYNEVSVFISFVSLLDQAQTSFIPESQTGWGRLFSAIAVYHVMVETGQGKFASIAGSVRTDHPAKQGLANMMVPFIEGFIVTTSAFLLYHVSGTGFDLFNPIDFEGTDLASNTYMQYSWLFFMVGLFAFTLAGMGGWSFAGRQAAAYLGGRRVAQMYLIVYLLIIFVGGFVFRFDDVGHRALALNATIVSGLITSLIPLLSLLLMSKHIRYEYNRYLTQEPVAYEISRDLFVLLLVLMPKNLVSRMFGWLTYIQLPRFLMVPVIQAFARFYKINVDEAELQIKDYRSLNKFFTRALKKGARVVNRTDRVIVSPVDGRVSMFGEITDGKMIQAKGIRYDLDDLLEWPEFTEKFQGGKYMVIYLSPQDYHRIHNPHEGDIVALGYTPGKLFTVNRVSVTGVQDLFPKNERLTSYFSTDYGMMAVIKVGATNVGRIRVTYDKLITNRWVRFHRRKEYKEPIFMDRGDELGRFEMGSTVILLFEKDMMDFDSSIVEGQKVRYGEQIGCFRSTGEDG